MKALSPDSEASLPLELVEAIRSRRAVALVGSGMSRSLGFPSWQGLLEDLVDATVAADTPGARDAADRLAGRAKTAPEWVAEVIKWRSKATYIERLRAVFANYEPPSLSRRHALLCSLPFRGFLTTNYDQLLEDYLSAFDFETPSVVTPFQEDNPSSFLRDPRRFVVKLHGCARRDPGRLVLSSSEYFELMRDSRYERILAFIFQRYHVFTVGFGLTDADLRRFIEERRHLYGSICPTVFAVVPEHEITPIEDEAYRAGYNVSLIPVSAANGYEQIEDLLFSLFCLVHSVDSQRIAGDVSATLSWRLENVPFLSASAPQPLPPSLERANRALSTLKDPVPLELFSSWMAELGDPGSSAHYRLLGKQDHRGRLAASRRAEPQDSDVREIATFLRRELAPLTAQGTVYEKEVLEHFSRTLSSLLRRKTAVEVFLTTAPDTSQVFKKLSQFYKQTGRWIEWLELLNHLDQLTADMGLENIRQDVILDQVWILYWQRRYTEASQVFEQHEEILTSSKAVTYRNRLTYREASGFEALQALSAEVEEREPKRLDDWSLLGQLYARMARLDVVSREALLQRAAERFQEALNEAQRESDLKEIGVQSYYLTCVHTEIGDLDGARANLAEERRIERGVLRRAPGIAWLHVAEYRVACLEHGSDHEVAQALRTRAAAALGDLGIVAPERVLDEDYV